MVGRSKMLKRAYSYVVKNWFTFFAIITYLFFAVYYMGPNVWDCTNTVGGIGDNTAGPIWRAANAGRAPIGGEVKTTNYPWGESLASPIDAVIVGQSVVMWATAKIAGPVCGYNLANVIGYLSSATIMYAFVYSLLNKKNKWIAWLAGYAVTFTPYFQVKIEGHPSYGFQAILIGVLWAFLSLIKTRKKSRVAILAFLIALCFYFDPYFSLLSASIVGPLGVVWFIVRTMGLKKSTVSKKMFINEVKLLSVSLLVVILAVLPLAYIMISQSAQIKASVAGTRDNVIDTAKMCSNWPQEYFLPFPNSPLFSMLGSEGQKIHTALYGFSTCGLAEDAVGISITMVLVLSLFIIIVAWERLQKRRVNIDGLMSYDPRITLLGSTAIAFGAVLLALPPLHVLGLPLPSFILVSLSSIWRIISREYVVVNIIVVLLFSVALAYFSQALRFGRGVKSILFLAVFLSIFIQYQAFLPFQSNPQTSFKYSNAPTGYYWLKEQEGVRAVVEYPIEKAAEANAHGYYLTMQLIHGKPLLNSALLNSPYDGIRSSLESLTDPQTIPALHALGIDEIIIHGVDPSDIAKIPYLQVMYSGTHKPDGRLPDSPAITKDSLVIAKIDANTPLIRSTVQFKANLPRNAAVQTSAINWQYETPTGTVVGLHTLIVPSIVTANQGGLQIRDKLLCFSVRMASLGDTGNLIIKKGPSVITSTAITDEYKTVMLSLDNNTDVKLESSNGHNMRLTDLGCGTE